MTSHVSRMKPQRSLMARAIATPSKQLTRHFILASVVAVWLCLPTCVSVGRAAESPAPLRSKQRTLEAWTQSRFGIFLHWGPCSILDLGDGSWDRAAPARAPNAPVPAGTDANAGSNKTQQAVPEVITSGDFRKYRGKNHGGVPQEVYDNLFHVFDPKNFDARQWARLFKESGAGYVVFTTKHHDGFCMFDTKTQHYSITHTPFRRDVTRELADACRAEGLMFFVYYSYLDWWNPGWTGMYKDGPYLDSVFLPQMEELLTNYGPIDGWWWDGGNISGEGAKRTLELFAKHQPWVIHNNRLGVGGIGQDYKSIEQRFGQFRVDGPWESCFTMTSEHWFWNGGRNLRNAATCVRYLIDCACCDGNLLLDAGPRPDGQIDQPAADNYRAIGRFLDDYGRSIRGTRGGPYKPGFWGGSTRAGKHVFLHVTAILEDKRLTLPPLPAKVTAVRCLTGGEAEFEQTDKALVVRFATQAPVDVILELTLDRDALSLQAIETDPAGRRSLADDAAVTASSIGGKFANKPACLVRHAWEKGGATLQFGEPGYEQQQIALAEMPDHQQPGYRYWSRLEIGHPFRYWEAKPDDFSPWLELDFGGKKTFTEICLMENTGYTEAFACDGYVGGDWKTLFTAQQMGLYNRRLEQPVTASKLRLRFLKTSGPVSLSSIMLLQ